MNLQSLFEFDEDVTLDSLDLTKMNSCAWMGDNILQNFASKYLWENATEDEKNEGLLSKKRSKLVCNRSLSIFLDSCTTIALKYECNDHTKGTLFEHLLYKCHSNCPSKASRAFEKYVRRMEQPDMVAKLLTFEIFGKFYYDLKTNIWSLDTGETIKLEEVPSAIIQEQEESQGRRLASQSKDISKRLKPREYQVSAANQAISQNRIINVRTGGGKTLIAVLVVDHFLKTSPRKVLFIVPSRALVAQQSQYLRNNSSFIPNGGSKSYILKICEMCGQEFGSWDQSKWRQALQEHDVFVGTAEIFRLAFVDLGFISPVDFSLVVFDECHNAVGNHPMAAILRDSIVRVSDSERPRILGLTASFVNGSMKNIVAKRSDLEALFNATLYTPVVADSASQDKKFSLVKVQKEDLSSYKTLITPVIESVLGDISFELGKEYSKWVNRGWALFVELGLDGLRFWLREGLVTQLEAISEEMKKRTDDYFCKRISMTLDHSMPRMRSVLRQRTLSLEINLASGLPQVPHFSQKIVSLLLLLWDLVGKCEILQSGNGKVASRGIVFVEQVAMTYPLAFLVNRFFESMKKQALITNLRSTTHQVLGGVDDIMTILQASAGDYNLAELEVKTMLPVSGANSMKDAVRVRNLDTFRHGKVPLLVSTNALEEGIDVPECDFIVRFDAFTTTKSHIQGSGRARCESAKIFYFENDPNVECSNAEMMEEVGRNDCYKLSREELSDSLRKMQRQSMNGAIAPVNYPFRPNHSTASMSPSSCIQSQELIEESVSGEVNFFNCLTIFFKYVQCVLKQSLLPESLFDWRDEKVCDFPYEVRKVLEGVYFPSPTGFQTVSHTDVDDFWSGFRIEDVVLPLDRYEKMSGEDRDKRRAVYVVVVRLHSLGLLTSSNEPSPQALAQTKFTCEALVIENRLHLKNKFATGLLTPSTDTQETVRSPATMASTGSRHSTTSTSTLASSPSPSGMTEIKTAQIDGKDYKSLLQQIVQKSNPHTPVITLVKYATLPAPIYSGPSPSFQSTVTVERVYKFSNESATGNSCLRKKDAEQSAAHALLTKLFPEYLVE